MKRKIAMVVMGLIFLGTFPANYFAHRLRYTRHARTPEGFAEIIGVELRPGTEIRDYKLYDPPADGPNSFWLLHDEGGLRYLAEDRAGRPCGWFRSFGDAWPELPEPVRSFEIIEEFGIGDPKMDNFLYLSTDERIAIVYDFRP